MIHRDVGRIPDLSALRPGQVSISAPVENDAIQVGRTYRERPTEKVGLHVVVEPGLVVVSRADELPLQLEGYTPTGEWERHIQLFSRRMLLPEPLGRLSLRAEGPVVEVWGIDEVDIAGQDHGLFTEFAWQIGVQSLRKQREAKGRAL